jgi:hypothetical protein
LIHRCLQVVLNYETLLTRIAKTFSQIADILPRADLHLRLYTTDRMIADVAQIYAQILLFLRRATCWYAKNRLQRSLAAIGKPFEISFQDIVDEISVCARRVDAHASAAMKAELRDLHVEMMQMRESTNGKSVARFDRCWALTVGSGLVAHPQRYQRPKPELLRPTACTGGSGAVSGLGC